MVICNNKKKKQGSFIGTFSAPSNIGLNGKHGNIWKEFGRFLVSDLFEDLRPR